MKNLMTIRDAVSILNISIITIRRLIKKHEIPYHKIGRKFFFTEEDILAYLSKTAVPIGGLKNENSK